MNKIEYIIAPPKHFLSIDWRELWHYRDLFYTLAWRDVAVRYKQTMLGVAWAVLQPLATMLVFTFIFNRMAKIESGDDTPYPVFLYVGLLLWQYFSGTLTNASNSMVGNAPLIQKVYFPRLIIPASTAITGLVDFVIAALILVGMMVYFGFVPSLHGVLLLPILLVTTILAAMGGGMYLAALNVKYRDVRHALPFLIQTMMYVTPVIYPVKLLDNYPVIKQLMLWLNPISGVITNSRAALLGQGSFDWPVMGISFLVSCAYFALGMYYFRNMERYFADIA